MTDAHDIGVFEASVIQRLAVELARTWVISHHLATGKLPEFSAIFAYPRSPDAAMDWGADPNARPEDRPLFGRRVRIELTIEGEHDLI